MSTIDHEQLCHSKIYVAGHRGLVGSATVRYLQAQGYNNIVTRTHAELDLMNQEAVNDFYSDIEPDLVIVAAAKVGGIYANNTYPAEFLYNNLMIEANLIHGAYAHCVDRLVFLGSSCIYPKFATQPMQEEYLLTGSLEPTNEPYAIAKIAGIKLCEAYNRQYNTDFRSLMPTNLYGPHDNFDLENSHVIPALIRKFHEAKLSNDKSVTIWGSGTVKREFLYVDDLASAIGTVLAAELQDYIDATDGVSHLNVGTGEDISIADLAYLVKEVTEYQGEVVFDTSMPEGTPQKLLDIQRIQRLGWQPAVKLREGLKSAYNWYLESGTGDFL